MTTSPPSSGGSSAAERAARSSSAEAEQDGILKVLVASDARGLAESMSILLDRLEFVHLLRGCTLDDTHRYVNGLKPDILILVPLPQGGASAHDISEITSLGAPVLICPFASPALHTRLAFRAGVMGVVTAEDGFEEMPDALRAVAAGEQYISQTAARELANSSAPDLTGREMEICRLVALGYSNSEIAERLFLSTRTVENHRSTLREKIGAANRRDLVEFALRNGLVA